MYDDNIQLIVNHMREQQFRWQDKPDMCQMTISEMMALERWLSVAEEDASFVSVSQSPISIIATGGDERHVS